MGKEMICFVTIWITLGNIHATFSSDVEPAANSTAFGKIHIYSDETYSFKQNKTRNRCRG